MVVYALCMCMIVLFIISFYAANQEIISPSVVFLAPFSLATVDLIYNIEKWHVDLKWNTFYLIIGGTISFLLAISLCKLFRIAAHSKKRIGNFYSGKTVEGMTEKDVKFPRINYVFFAALQLLTFIVCLRAVTSIARRYGVSGGISALIAGYKSLKTFTTEDISLGGINNILYDFCYASGYVWFYIVAYSFTHKMKIDKWALVNLVLSIAISLEKGSRGGAVALICSGAAMFVLFWQKDSRRGRLSFKQLMAIIIGAVVLVGTFQTVGELLGRISSADFEGYLAVYLSAPIRNLDYFLSKTHSVPDIFGEMTFVRLINYLGGKLDISSWVYEMDLPSLYANGYVTGNVYTTFYAYTYDFGYIGVPVMMFLMGIISQTIYRKAKDSGRSKHSLNIWEILYAYIFYLLAFSFFSNKFYEGIVAIQFVKYILYWLVIRYYMERIRFRFG